MDKIDILGYTPVNHKSNHIQSKDNIDYLDSPKNNMPATEFASFIRDQTKKNMHLNYYTKKLILETSKLDLTKLKMFRFDKLSKEEIVTILSKCVIKVTDEIVAINKPNGLSVQDGGSQTVSIGEILADLSKALHLPETLHLVHRLDKDTTGVLLLARNREAAFLLKEAFRKGQIRKNYLCLSHGLPNPPEGIIDFPLKERVVDGNVIIAPDIGAINDPRKRDKSSIITAYKTLCSNFNIALVQCAMTSGVKHQVRAHLAYALETPIIGDHKYAWLINKGTFPILPQSLSPPALAGLKLPAGKTRCLPVFLHAHHIIIGQPRMPTSGFDGRAELRRAADADGATAPCRLGNLQLYANLPPFFVDTLKSLRLYDLRFLKGVLRNVL